MYVLIDELETKRRNKNVYLKANTLIGPMYTEELEKSKKFDTKKAALNETAYLHSSCSFAPHKI